MKWSEEHKPAYYVLSIAFWVGWVILAFIGLYRGRAQVKATWLDPTGNRILKQTFAVTAVGLVSMILYWFRQRFRTQYGLAEIAFGGVSAWVLMGKIVVDSGYVELIGLVGAVYLMVRGADNVQQGQDAKLKKSNALRSTYFANGLRR